MRRANQFDRFFDGQWHTVTPSVDVKSTSQNAVGATFRSACEYRDLVPFVKNNPDGTVSILGASREQARELRGENRVAPRMRLTLDVYLAKYKDLGHAERAALTGRILADSRG